MTSAPDLALPLAMGGLGAGAGLLFAGAWPWVVAAALVGLAVGWLLSRAGVRPVVGTAIVAGGLVGAWIGRAVVRALCLPGACPAVEVAGALFTGIGALLGIGLVVALVVRSFDEYRERGPAPGGT